MDVMNLFSICHLDVNVMPNEFIYLVLLKVYYVNEDCFVMLLFKFLKKMLYTCIFFKENIFITIGLLVLIY